MKTLALLVLSIPAWANWSAPIQTKLAFATSGALTQSITLDSTPTVGHIVIVGLSQDNTNTLTTSGLTDNQAGIGNSYSRVAFMFRGGSTNNPNEASIWCTVVNAASGTFTITATNTNSTFAALYAAEYSGGSCNPDQNSSNSMLQTTSPFSCGSITTTNANDLLVSVISQNVAGNPIVVQPLGFTLQQQQGSNSGETGAYADQVVSSTGSFSPTWTSTEMVATNCVVAALEASGGGGGGGGTISAVFP